MFSPFGAKKCSRRPGFHEDILGYELIVGQPIQDNISGYIITQPGNEPYFCEMSDLTRRGKT
jgi:hypothetical protein